MKIDTHCHTIYSKHKKYGTDALNTPEEMIKAAIKADLGGLAITDHNSVKGSLVGRKISKEIDRNFKFITGSEISTSSGDLLALGIEKDVQPGLSIEETAEKIHEQGGIAVAAHPFSCLLARKCLGNEAVKADAIEVFNSNGTTKNENEKALRLAEKYRRPKTAGSDSHSFHTVGNAGIICEEGSADDILEKIRKGKVEIFGKSNPMLVFAYVNLIKRIRGVKWKLSGKKSIELNNPLPRLSRKSPCKLLRYI